MYKFLTKSFVHVYSLTLLLFISFSLQGCFYITKSVNNIGKRQAGFSGTIKEVRYANNGDIAIKTDIKHCNFRAVKPTLNKEVHRVKNFIIFSKYAMYDNIKSGMAAKRTERDKKRYGEYPENSIKITPKISTTMENNFPYLLALPFSNIKNFEPLLPISLNENNSKILGDDQSVKHFSKQYSGEKFYIDISGKQFFPYTLDGKEYLVAITYSKHKEKWDIEKKLWEKRLWWGYPFQVLKYGPSQVLDILTMPIQFFIALDDFNDSFN